MAEFREITQDELNEILEQHRKWVESEGKEGEKADLFDANLQEADLCVVNFRDANLTVANLQEANLSRAHLRGANLGTDLTFGRIRDLTAPQVKKAKNWELAFYEKDFLKELGLPPDHNKTFKKKLAELEKKEKEAATKK